MNYATIKNNDIADGLGIRVSLFVSGCPIHCEGCHNKEAWDYNYGKPFTKETVDEILKMCEKESISGLSILGGEPLAINNIEEVCNLIVSFRKKFHFTKTIWLYTGFRFEDLPIKAGVQNFVDFLCTWVDVIVDGPFIQEKKNMLLNYRGSSNQNIRVFSHALPKLSNPTIYNINDKLKFKKFTESEVPGRIELAIEMFKDTFWDEETFTEYEQFLVVPKQEKFIEICLPK